MESYHDTLVAEIHATLNRLAEGEKVWDATWITHAVCNGHVDGLADHEDREFWRWNAYANVREMVRKEINRRADPPAGEKGQQHQLALRGFDRDHLQDYYMVEREDRRVAVPVTQLSDDELEAKASHYRSIGATCYAHADEIERFKGWRVGSSAA